MKLTPVIWRAEPAKYICFARYERKQEKAYRTCVAQVVWYATFAYEWKGGHSHSAGLRKNIRLCLSRWSVRVRCGSSSNILDPLPQYRIIPIKIDLIP